jgi:HSP20 family protein
MLKDKKSFFERLAGTITVEDEEEMVDINDEYEEEETPKSTRTAKKSAGTIEHETPKRRSQIQAIQDEYEEEELEEEEGELSVDVYQTSTDIIIEAMVAGVKPEDLHLSITRDMVTIKGKRDANNAVGDDDYFYRELYWGNFTRTILLPHEVIIEDSEAVEKHGLLIIRMPKIDKAKQTKLKVKSI